MSYIERESLLIDVDSLISMMHVQAKGEPIQESAIKLVETTRDYIASLTAADVAEVRHGHWINIPPYNCEAGYKKGQQCSECYAYYISEGTTPWSNHKYCAECGAKMDGEIEWDERGQGGQQ